MAGKTCRGPFVNSNVRPGLARSYCEGREAAAAGKPDTADPHEADSEASLMWLTGHFSWDEGAPETFLRDCCALPHGGGFA